MAWHLTKKQTERLKLLAHLTLPIGIQPEDQEVLRAVLEKETKVNDKLLEARIELQAAEKIVALLRGEMDMLERDARGESSSVSALVAFDRMIKMIESEEWR